MVVRLAIDTNRYSDLAVGVPIAIDTVAKALEVYVPFAVLAELHIGFRKGGRRADNARKLEQFLSKSGVKVLYPDAATVDVFSNVALQLARQGTPIPSHDIWIAALCLQHGLTLFSREKHFDYIPQLMRI